MNSSLASLERLLMLSEAMASAAAASDWEGLAERESERRALADSLPPALFDGTPPSAREHSRRLIESCLACDARVRGLVETRLHELGVLLRVTPIDR